jgi:hypothetical protein
MNKRLTRIAPLKAGIVLGVLYALLACIMVPFLLLAGAGMAAAARSNGGSIPMGFMFGAGALFLPIMYGGIGFICGLIAAAVYNLVAKWTGGVEINLVDIA